jgi:hypothetical protein
LLTKKIFHQKGEWQYKYMEASHTYREEAVNK